MNKRLPLVLASLTLIIIGLWLGRAYRDRVVRAAVPAVPSAGVKGAAGGPAPQTAVVTNAQAPQATTLNPGPGGSAAPATSRSARKRAWDYGFFSGLGGASPGDALRFELVDGEYASGTLRYLDRRNGDLWYVAGQLTSPEAGRFFFQKQTLPGKAGDFVGVVEFPASRRAFRLEPSGPNGSAELVERPLDQVVCLRLPLPDSEATNTVAEVPPLKPADVPGYIPAYNDGIISLQSLPGATGVLYIDYRGGYTPTWGGITYDRPNVSNAQIKDVWKRVAEDYMAFNVNVTTDSRVYQNAPESSRQRCVVTPTSTAAPGAGGVAYLQSWNWTGDTPCWVFMTTGKACAEAVSHEVGHTLWLSHDGQDVNGVHTEYYGGQGSGAVGWAPIMGVGYYQPVSQWSKGEYTNANNTEDDLNLITTKNNNVSYRADDTGSTLATSRYLEINPNFTAWAEGVIERTADTDAFQFTTGGGQVTLTANPVGDWGNLAIMATLANSSDTVIASNNPQTQLAASITTVLPAGTYTFRVTGTGRNNPLTDGFSAYASLGYYSITGYVAAARLPTRMSIAEHSPNGTIVGTIPVNNIYANPLAFVIASGNAGGTFALDASGTVSVANNTLLDYRRLATNSASAVQFELFVNITNLANPALTELNRRVVIAVLNVNDPPVVVGFTNSVFEHSQPGLVLGTVTVADPDFSEPLSYSVAGGDPAGLFAIDQNGVVSVAGDLSAANQKAYTLAVAVNDNAAGNPITSTGYVTINVLTNLSPFHPGSISYAVFDNIGSGNLVSDLTNNARFPSDPTFERQMPTFEGDSNRADGYGGVMRGYLFPPVTGVYTFYIATDDNGELWMSASTNPAAMTLIASISGSGNWASPRQWNKYASQQSAARVLVAGQAYYIEARMKEGNGGDNIAVGWKGPATANLTNVIAGQYLAPRFLNYLPHLTGFTASVRRDAIAGTRLGRVTVSDVNTNDTCTLTILSGNADGIFAVDAAGWVRVFDDAALQATPTPSYTLTIQSTDSSSPPLSATATVVLNITEANGIVPTALQREMFYNIGGGTAVSDLTNSTKFPGRPDALVALTGFSSPLDVADNYGSRIRGLLTPPLTGPYRFFLASDDNSQLFVSTDDSSSNAVRIASVPGWTSVNTWTTYPQQTSAGINLVAGQAYYIEALQKEGGGGDHVEVAWAGPGIVDTNGLPATNLISGSFLTPVDLNYPPQFTNQVLQVFNTVGSNTLIGNIYAADSPLDSLTFKLVDGNTNDIFALAPDTGGLSVVDNALIANGTVTNAVLTVLVQDSGYGGQYPLRTAQATVTVNVVGTNNSALVWTGAAGTNDWANSGNWAGVVPGMGTRVVFGYPSQQANVNDVVTALASAQFTSGGFNVSGDPLTLQSGITNTTGDNTWGLNTTLGAPQSWANAAGTLRVNGGVTNGGRLLTLVANSDIQLNGPVSGTGGLTKSGTARLLMQGTHVYSGGTVVAAASGSTAALQLAGPGDLDIRNSDLNMLGRMDLGNHNATIGALNGSGTIFANDIPQPTLTIGANGHSGSFSGVIQDNTAGYGITLGVAKTGIGTETLSGNNTFTGGFVVSGGTITLNSGNGSSPAGRGILTINSGAIVNATADNQLGNEANGYLTVLNIVGGTFNSWNYTHVNSITFKGGMLGITSGASQVDGMDLRAFNSVNPVVTTMPGASSAIITSKMTLNAPALFNVADGAPANDLFITGLIVGGNPLIKAGPGTLALSADCTYTGGTLITAGVLQLGVGGATGSVVGSITNNSALVYNRSAAFTQTGVLSGVGSLTKTGSGTLTLTGVNTYSGPTILNQGTLALGPAGSIANSASIAVQAGATLDASALTGGLTIPAAQTLSGNGALAGYVRVNGALLPGASIGGLTFNGSLVLGGLTLMEINKANGALTNDWAAVSGALTFGGTLVVTNSGDGLSLGDAFPLFSAGSFGGWFNAVTLPPLGPGLHWATNQLALDGTLRVAAPTPPLIMPVSLVGTNLQISVASEFGVTYVLQSANVLDTPSAWLSISTNNGTGGLLTIPAPVDPAQPQQFFRLQAY